MKRQKKREARLKNLRERAQHRRDLVYATETETERHARLIRQSEYARQRRIKMNTKEGRDLMEKRARELYIKIHSNQEVTPTDTVPKIENEDEDNDSKKFNKILEPIINMH